MYTENKENNAIAQFYHAFDGKRWNEFRDMLIERAGISRASFYNYLTGRSKEPKLVTEKVREILMNNFNDVIIQELITEKQL